MNETLRVRGAELAGQGKTYRQIARELGVAPLEVYEAIGDTGERSDFARMAAMAASGMTYTEIGRRFGMTRQAVGKQLGPRARRPRTVVRKIRIEESTYDRVRDLAGQLGLRSGRGPIPTGGSVGLLLDAIARGELIVTVCSQSATKSV